MNAARVLMSTLVAVQAVGDPHPSHTLQALPSLRARGSLATSPTGWPTGGERGWRRRVPPLGAISTCSACWQARGAAREEEEAWRWLVVLVTLCGGGWRRCTRG